jgi:excisionase family DNA binding protein
VEVHREGISASWTDAEAALLGDQLAKAVQLFRRSGQPVPLMLRTFADQMNAAVRATRGTANAQVTPPGCPVRGNGIPTLSCSDEPDTLMSVDAAAELAEVHPRTVYKWVQRGHVQAWQDPRNGEPLRVDIASLWVYIGQRRREHDR